ncbi:MAG: MFS transporter [Candidatus Hodarchaeota archaeon]
MVHITDDSSSPPRVFFGLSSFQILAMFRRGLFYSYLSIYLRFFLGLSVTETTLFATIPMILNVAFQMFVWGVLSDKYQLRRTLVIVGELFAGIGTLIVWYAHTLDTDQGMLAGYTIIVGLSIVEIFWSMSNTGWYALISDLYPYEERNTVQGKLASLGGLGRIIGVWVGGLLYDGFQIGDWSSARYDGWGFWEGSLFFVAALAMFLSAIPMFFMPEGGIYQEIQKEESLQENNDSSSSIGVFIVFLIAMAFINFGRNSIALIFSQYLVLDSGFNVSSELLSYVINAESLAILFMGLIVGWIGHRIGIGNTILFGAAMSIAALLVIAFSSDLRLIFVASFLRGAAQVTIMTSAYAFASKLIPAKNRAKLFGVYNATFFLSWGIAGTLIAGPVTDIMLWAGMAEDIAYRAAFLAAAIVTFIGTVILAILLLWLRTQAVSEEAQETEESMIAKV